MPALGLGMLPISRVRYSTSAVVNMPVSCHIRPASAGHHMLLLFHYLKTVLPPVLLSYHPLSVIPYVFSLAPHICMILYHVIYSSFFHYLRKRLDAVPKVHSSDSHNLTQDRCTLLWFVVTLGIGVRATGVTGAFSAHLSVCLFPAF